MSYCPPLCAACGGELAAKMGTTITVCIKCGKEFELVEK